MKHYSKNQYGFTIVETMVSLVILAIGLIALIGLQSTTMRMSHKNRVADIGKTILVSEIDSIMPLSNFQLQNKANVGDADARTALPDPYKGTLFAKADVTVPAGYDYVRWRGIARTSIADDSSNNGAELYFLVKIAIDKKYLLQDVLARGQVTVYWPDATRGVDFLQTTFFIQRK